MSLLEIEELRVTFNTPTGPVSAVRGVSLTVEEGEILGVVGESGCGKSVSFRSLLGLAPSSAKVQGTVRFDSGPVDLDGSLRSVAAMIYQNPGAALNPVFTIGQQLAAVAGTDDKDRLEAYITQAGLRDGAAALAAYPHEFSGGMRQRAVIALALAQHPRLLIADEPTTALDVTTQAAILELIKTLRDEQGLTVVFISHDLAVIRRLCDRIAVMYAGQVIEEGATEQVLTTPNHPYTQALIEAIPHPSRRGKELTAIPGMVPDGRQPIAGCAYADRCPHRRDECDIEQPQPRAVTIGHSVACVLVEESS